MITELLRDHAADVHLRGCPAQPCTCLRDRRAGDLMREAAARIEVCLEAIDLAIGEQDNTEKVIDRIKAARYALLAARPEPFKAT